MRPANNDPVKQCLIIYHIRMDTLETQKQFGLWWACHSISRLKSLIQRDPDPKCRNIYITKHWCKCFDTLSNKLWKQYPPKRWTISETSTSSFTSSQRNPEASWGFPTNILLRGHGHGGYPSHPRPPSPRGAARPRNRGLARLRCAAVCCLRSRSPREATGRTQRNEGEKNSEKSKVEVLEILATQKSCLNSENNAVLRMFWWHRVGWKRPCEPSWQSKCIAETEKDVPSPRKQICVRLGHSRIWNQSPTVGISCNRVRGL